MPVLRALNSDCPADRAESSIINMRLQSVLLGCGLGANWLPRIFYRLSILLANELWTQYPPAVLARNLDP